MNRRKQKRRPGGGGVGKAQARANAQRNHNPGASKPQVIEGFDNAAAVASRLSGVTVVFALDQGGRIAHDATVFYAGKPMALVPVHLLPRLVDAYPEADTRELRHVIASFNAEQAGMGGRG